MQCSERGGNDARKKNNERGVDATKERLSLSPFPLSHARNFFFCSPSLSLSQGTFSLFCFFFFACVCVSVGGGSYGKRTGSLPL
jgi:hypothetical protein